MKVVSMPSPNIYTHYNDLPDTLIIGKEIALDTETMGLNVNRDRLCLLQLKDETDNVHLIQFIDNQYDAPNLKKILTNREIIKIFHYARFDILAIYSYLGVLCENIFCTKIASKLSRTYTDKHGLKVLCQELLGIELQKEQQSSNWGAEALSEEQKIYAANDVMYLHKLKQILSARLIREKRFLLAKSCFDFLPTKAILDSLDFKDGDEIFNH